MKQTLTVFSPAKVNLQLEIGERRTDGFHQAKSIMQALTLHDMVTVVLDDGVDAYLSPDGFSDFAIDVTCTTFEGIPELDVAPESNIAYKAAAALAEKLGHEQGHISIHIEKHIPFEAGLGGGSADAAAVLRALNRAYDAPLSIPALCELGAQVGSDVPFCVMGGTAIVEGRGELLTKLPPAPEFFLVICKPDFSVSTPELYRNLDETFIEKRPDHKSMQLNLQKGELLGVGGSMCNVFEPLVLKEHFDINYIRSMMYTYGAYGAQMTGSGSAVFGIYDSFEYATVACTMLKDKYSEIFLAKTV